MEKILMILEVSQKQSYIFSSKQLRENVARSEQIAYATSSGFFRKTAAGFFDEKENLIYTGGGHTVLQFSDKARALGFARAITHAVLKQFPGMELFVKQIPYDDSLSPQKNLENLSQALERKKSLRNESFRYLSLGMEKLDPVTFQPLPCEREQPEASAAVDSSLPKAPGGYKFPAQFEELTGKELAGEELSGKENFIAVIHIDGNAMGTKVAKIYEKYSHPGADWEECCKSLKNFSDGIDLDFKNSFREMVDEMIARQSPDATLPVRPLILAGDDVCFVTRGKIGLECARVFLERLARKENVELRKLSGVDAAYAACAGVALVHKKYPFHRAYELAEELCSSAKRFGASLDPAGRISAMDWHIEFGQLKDGLSALRKTDYITEDGDHLTLRPVTVLVPDSVGKGPEEPRTYHFFRRLCTDVKKECSKIARGKIKELRTALKQGKIESEFFLKNNEIHKLLRLLGRETENAHGIIDGEEYCLLFDAIELMDHYTAFGEEEAK